MQDERSIGTTFANSRAARFREENFVGRPERLIHDNRKKLGNKEAEQKVQYIETKNERWCGEAVFGVNSITGLVIVIILYAHIAVTCL